MKKLFYYVFLFLCQFIYGQIQHQQLEKLTTTCKVWGFLKYYHPKIAGGQVDWNKKLLNLIQKVDKIKTKEEFSVVFENLIDSLGVVESKIIEIPKNIEYFDKNFDLSWFNNNVFSQKLSLKLKHIEKNRYQGS